MTPLTLAVGFILGFSAGVLLLLWAWAMHREAEWRAYVDPDDGWPVPPGAP